MQLLIVKSIYQRRINELWTNIYNFYIYIYNMHLHLNVYLKSLGPSMEKTNDKQSWKESSTVSIHQQIGFYNLYENQIDRGAYNLYSFFQHSRHLLEARSSLVQFDSPTSFNLLCLFLLFKIMIIISIIITMILMMVLIMMMMIIMVKKYLSLNVSVWKD